MGNSITTRGPGVSVIASATTWIEGEALRQLDDTARLPGMREAVGMPDLHPGKAGPVGAAFLSDGVVRPTLVGSDIGCGMALWATDLPARKAHPERLAERLKGLDEPWEGDTAAWLAERGLEPTSHDAALGTIGHGNHFAELQRLAQAVDRERFAALGLDADFVYLLVHTGSRGLGEATLRAHVERFRAEGLRAGTDEAGAYLAEHDRAVTWARANRDLVAHRVFEAVGTEGRLLLDVCHNNVVPAEVEGCACWLHRKGAAPATQGPVVIPGSRGDVSVLVEPVADRRDALWSLAHGAGRKLARHEAKGKLRGWLRREDLRTNPFGGVVVCGDDHLLWEEAPGAYKDAASVVGDLVAAGLVRVIAVFEPLVTFKCSDALRKVEAHERRERSAQRREARRAKAEARR